MLLAALVFIELAQPTIFLSKWLHGLGVRAPSGIADLDGPLRIYLGAHYPSDVLAGWLVGAVVAAGAWQLVRLLRRLPRPAFAA